MHLKLCHPRFNYQLVPGAPHRIFLVKKEGEETEEKAPIALKWKTEDPEVTEVPSAGTAEVPKVPPPALCSSNCSANLETIQPSDSPETPTKNPRRKPLNPRKLRPNTKMMVKHLGYQLEDLRKFITGNENLDYYTGRPLMAHELDRYSQEFPEWLARTHEQRVQVRDDLNEGEKEFMQLWNKHMKAYGR